MSFCNKCGTQLPDGVKFCVSCGEPVTNPSQVQVNTNERQPMTQSQNNQQPMNQGYQQPVNQGYQQPMQQGYQQPVNQGYQQPMQQGYQQPVNQGYQQPMQQCYQQPVNQGCQRPRIQINQRRVPFQEAVRSAIEDHYVDFTGRASRSEFWWFVLALYATNVIFFLIGALVHDYVSNVIGWIIIGLMQVFSLAVLLPYLGLAVRRLHDTGKSGWWLLLGLIPIVGIFIVIYMLCKESDPYPNQYGPIPNVIS